MITDPIADLLTRIRNASRARHEKTMAPSSRFKKEVLRVLQEKKAIRGFEEMDEGVKKTLIIRLFPERKIELKRISSPGQRLYRQAKQLRPVLRGFGFSILSTSQGVMTGDEAKKKSLGGEVICEVF